MATHYLLTAIWTFFVGVGQAVAINSFVTANPRTDRNFQLKVFSSAWNDTVDMLGWGIVLASVYGLICYTAVAASSSQNQSASHITSQDDREPADGPESPNGAF